MKPRHVEAERINARETLKALRIEVGQDYHTLAPSQVEGQSAAGRCVMFKLEIDTDNDSFQPDPREEIARILEDVAEALLARPAADTKGKAPLFDTNGNRCGTSFFCLNDCYCDRNFHRPDKVCSACWDRLGLSNMTEEERADRIAEDWASADAEWEGGAA
jgi:hypothetical protein